MVVVTSRAGAQVSMRRVTGVLRRHVFLQEACSTVNRAAEGRVGGGAGGAEGQGGDGRCWEEPFAVDIRYDESTNQVQMLLARRRVQLVPQVQPVFGVFC